ncbi:hypothetical protein TNCV_933291 [Trichonephila clavipes]|nr:hypothetical protein TNCV_933291 [Trichonephila clavipes]
MKGLKPNNPNGLHADFLHECMSTVSTVYLLTARHHAAQKCLEKRNCLQDALNLLQNVQTEVNDVLSGDFSGEEVPANFLLELLQDS